MRVMHPQPQAGARMNRRLGASRGVTLSQTSAPFHADGRVRRFAGVAGAVVACAAFLTGCKGPSDAAARGGDTPAAAVATEAASRPYFPVRRCMQFANALDAPREGDWGYRIRDADIRTVARAGFDAIRVPIQWSAYASETPPYRLDPAIFARADHVFRLALDQNLAVIFTLHNYDEMTADPAGHRARLIAIWDQIARHYADWPADLIFEPFNEPNGQLSGAAWEGVADDLTAVIRVSNPTRTLIFGPPEWNWFDRLEGWTPPRDPYVVATHHYYAPWEFTVQGAEFLDNPPPRGRRWGTAQDRAQVRADIRQAADWARERQIPMLLGEFGVHIAAPASDRAAWLRVVREAAETTGQAWCHHDFATNFAAYEPQREAWRADVFDALMGVPPP